MLLHRLGLSFGYLLRGALLFVRHLLVFGRFNFAVAFVGVVLDDFLAEALVLGRPLNALEFEGVLGDRFLEGSLELTAALELLDGLLVALSRRLIH